MEMSYFIHNSNNNNNQIKHIPHMFQSMSRQNNFNLTILKSDSVGSPSRPIRTRALV